jgi:chemotaxis protein CheD
MADIGGRNGAFVQRFLTDESIPLESASLGGISARRIQFWPATGRARQHLVDAGDVPSRERALARPAPAVDGELELF